MGKYVRRKVRRRRWFVYRDSGGRGEGGAGWQEEMD
jgi:hypothetical protein